MMQIFTRTLLTLTAIAFVVGVGSAAYAAEISGTLSTSGEGTVIGVPSADPAGGSYSAAQSVELVAPIGADEVRYTTDGSDPACDAGIHYTEPIEVDESQLIRAVACYGGGAVSEIAEFAYALSVFSDPSEESTTSTGGGGGGGGGNADEDTTTSSDTEEVDFNDDGTVDVLDFNTLMVNWGTSGSNVPGDINGDNVVDILDFNTFMINWTV